MVVVIVVVVVLVGLALGAALAQRRVSRLQSSDTFAASDHVEVPRTFGPGHTRPGTIERSLSVHHDDDPQEFHEGD
jgi:hypothetical protein